MQVAFASNPTGATLGGTLSVTASQGVATFSGLTINKTGSGYTLQVTSSGLSSAVTNAMKVSKTATSSPAVAQGAINALDGAGPAGPREPGCLGWLAPADKTSGDALIRNPPRRSTRDRDPL